MSLIHRFGQNDHSWPFSPSPLAGLRIGGRRDNADPVRAAHVTDATIPEGHALDPSLRRAKPVPTLPSEVTALPVTGAAAFANRPIPRQSGLRLLPLESFAWGTRLPQVQPRTRGDWVLIWVTGGSLQLDYPRRRMLLRPGTVHFIPAGTAFATLPLQGTTGYVLLIASDLARQTRPELPDSTVTGQIGDAAPALLSSLRDMATEAQVDRPGATQAIASHLALLSVRLSRLLPLTPRHSESGITPADLPLIQRFLTLAGAELALGRTIADMAETLDTSTAALDRACLQAYGKRAIQMIHDLRYQRAVDALRHNSKPTTAIARELGYPSHANFIRTFVSRTGRLPEDFRRL